MIIKELKRGELKRAAKESGIPYQNLRNAHIAGKFEAIIKGGKINAAKVKEELENNSHPIKMANGRRSISPKVKGGKPKEDEPTQPEKEKAAQKAGLSMNQSHSELQKAKTFLECGLKQLELEKEKGKLVPADQVERAAYLAGLQIRESLESIPDRCAPLVAVESGQFECREIIAKEIDFILKGLSSALSVLQ